MERIDIEVWLHKIMHPKLWLHNKDILYQSGTSKEAEIGSIWPLASRVSELDLLHPISLPCGSSKLTLCIWECYRLTPWSLSWREKEMVVDDCDAPSPLSNPLSCPLSYSRQSGGLEATLCVLASIHKSAQSFSTEYYSHFVEKHKRQQSYAGVFWN